MNRALLTLIEEDGPACPIRAGNDEPMRRPDHRAKKHARPQPWLRFAAQEAAELTVILAFVVAVCAVSVGVA